MTDSRVKAVLTLSWISHFLRAVERVKAVLAWKNHILAWNHQAPYISTNPIHPIHNSSIANLPCHDHIGFQALNSARQDNISQESKGNQPSQNLFAASVWYNLFRTHASFGYVGKQNSFIRINICPSSWQLTFFLGSGVKRKDRFRFKK